MTKEERALVKNAGDPEQVAEAKKAEERREREWREDLREVMSTKAGRRVVWRLLQNARVFESRFDINSLRMAFLEGNANQGLWLLAELDAACPELFDLMRREAREESDD